MCIITLGPDFPHLHTKIYIKRNKQRPTGRGGVGSTVSHFRGSLAQGGCHMEPMSASLMGLPTVLPHTRHAHSAMTCYHPPASHNLTTFHFIHENLQAVPGTQACTWGPGAPGSNTGCDLGPWIGPGSCVLGVQGSWAT